MSWIGFVYAIKKKASKRIAALAYKLPEIVDIAFVKAWLKKHDLEDDPDQSEKEGD